MSRSTAQPEHPPKVTDLLIRQKCEAMIKNDPVNWIGGNGGSYGAGRSRAGGTVGGSVSAMNTTTPAYPPR